MEVEEGINSKGLAANLSRWRKLLKFSSFIFLGALAYLIFFPVFVLVLEIFFYDLVYDGPEWISQGLDHGCAPLIFLCEYVPLYEQYIDWLFMFSD